MIQFDRDRTVTAAIDAVRGGAPLELRKNVKTDLNLVKDQKSTNFVASLSESSQKVFRSFEDTSFTLQHANRGQ
jgi:hypothetical protein